MLTLRRCFAQGFAGRTRTLLATRSSSRVILDENQLKAEISENGHIALITLNDPSRLNALTEPMGRTFKSLVAQLKDDKKLRAVVVTGAGKAFSAGGDLQFLKERTESTPWSNSETMRDFYSYFLSIRQLPVPVIAAINGPAIGAGLCFATACDMRIVASNAKIGYTFVQLGLHPGMGATHFVPNVVGWEMAAKMLLTGEVISGEEAVGRRLALEAVEAEEVLPTAMALAESISKASSTAVRTSIQSLRLLQDESLSTRLHRESDAQSQSYADADMREGLAAIREKRKPVF